MSRSKNRLLPQVMRYNATVDTDATNQSLRTVDTDATNQSLRLSLNGP